MDTFSVWTEGFSVDILDSLNNPLMHLLKYFRREN